MLKLCFSCNWTCDYSLRQNTFTASADSGASSNVFPTVRSYQYTFGEINAPHLPTHCLSSCFLIDRDGDYSKMCLCPYTVITLCSVTTDDELN